MRAALRRLRLYAYLVTWLLATGVFVVGLARGELSWWYAAAGWLIVTGRVLAALLVPNRLPGK